MTKLSIITINLNNKVGLEKTIVSVLAQSYKRYEFVIIDGGSQDGSVEVLKKYSKYFSYLVSEADTGIFNAMNKGISAAKGEYLLFLNSGDFLVDDTVLSSMFANDPSEDIICGLSQVSEMGKIQFVSSLPATFTLQFFMHSTISHSAAFIKRSLFEECGYYSEDLKLNGDWEFWIRAIILKNCTTKISTIVVSDYNLEGISSSNSTLELGKKETEKILKKWIPERIMADYEWWDAEKKDMELFYWARSKKLIYFLVLFLNKMATFSGKVREKIRSVVKSN